MIVHSVICGYHDWAPAPPGTEITEADAAALRVKQMSDGDWHVRVVKVPPEGQDFHGTQIPEQAITDRMASLEKFGRSQSRAATVSELLASAYRHHLDAKKHLVEISVTDAGPNQEMFAADLARLGVTGPQADEAMASYMEPVDLDAYLNGVFQTKPGRRLHQEK